MKEIVDNFVNVNTIALVVSDIIRIFANDIEQSALPKG
jgi:hypothetical protein